MTSAATFLDASWRFTVAGQAVQIRSLRGAPLRQTCRGFPPWTRAVRLDFPHVSGRRRCPAALHGIGGGNPVTCRRGRRNRPRRRIVWSSWDPQRALGVQRPRLGCLAQGMADPLQRAPGCSVLPVQRHVQPAFRIDSDRNRASLQCRCDQRSGRGTSRGLLRPFHRSRWPRQIVHGWRQSRRVTRHLRSAAQRVARTRSSRRAREKRRRHRRQRRQRAVKPAGDRAVAPRTERVHDASLQRQRKPPDVTAPSTDKPRSRSSVWSWSSTRTSNR